MGEEEQGKKRRVVAESLGWLTESTIMPKKHRAIEGVGASSIVELKAQLYKSQEEARKAKDLAGTDVEYHRAKKKISPHDAFSVKNSGVESRAHKDKLELKAVQDGSASYAALEKKAALYEKLVRGELSDEEAEEKYCVDFFRKGIEVEESQKSQSPETSSSAAAAAASVNDEDGGDGPAGLFSTKFVKPGQSGGAFDQDEHRRFVSQVHEEANQAREKVSEMKLQRQEKVEARRKNFKQAYLLKKLEKLKAAGTSLEQSVEGGK
ncbi:unnamed protein product [Linum tenue]|uniref:Uncharacterized protein n=1 Tax=Linum tenue TaxID=586396 RepID=A0AAV0QJU1_9ROSI|nr:unnamed protein product [Linum tenue]